MRLPSESRTGIPSLLLLLYCSGTMLDICRSSYLAEAYSLLHSGRLADMCWVSITIFIVLLLTHLLFQKCGNLEHPSGMYNLRSSHVLNDSHLLCSSFTFLSLGDGKLFLHCHISVLILWLMHKHCALRTPRISRSGGHQNFSSLKKPSFYNRKTCF